MDDLIKTVTAKAGLSEEQAKKAVHAVVEFVKEKFPAVGGHIDGLLAGKGGEGGGMGDILGKLGGMLGGKS